MTDQILFDKLVYIDRLKRAGIGEDQARAYAEAMDEALREAVVTKGDLTMVRTDLVAAIVRLENKIDLGLRDVTIRTGSMLIVVVGVLVGFKFF